MIYRLGDQEYDELDFDDMTEEDLDNLARDADKFARDQDIAITRGKADWLAGGRGLTNEEYTRRKLAKAEALGLASAIKAYIPPAR